MKNILYILFFIAISYKTMAQIIFIPDTQFEQFLIDKGIDSDGVVNGQVLTTDIENITTLIIDNNYLTDITGIEDFAMLENLTVNFCELTSLDVSNNLNLKFLDVSNCGLTELDVSKNVLLEKLYCGNPTDDVGPHNIVSHIDLSSNPNINTLHAENKSIFLKSIILKNGNNNTNMKIDISISYYGMWDDPDYNPYDIYNTVCIEVDDEDLAQNNQFPYSE